MYMKEKIQTLIHFNMALIGGFLGGYALLNHCDIFGSAQTSNLIYIAMTIVGRNTYDFLMRIISLVIYMSGFAFTIIIPKHFAKANLKKISIIITCIVVIMIGCFNENMDDYIALFPVFFATAFQWNAFKGAEGYVSSTIFSTNNLRQFTTSFTEFLCDRDKSHLHKTRFYGLVLLSFHIGVGIAYVSSITYGFKGAWVCLLPALTALSLVFAENNIEFINLKISKFSNLHLEN